jgi:uncharacterized protein YndB with AHSA1/START domain
MELVMTNGLKMEAGADREVVVTRVIGAPRPIVFDAFTKPEIIKRWMLGPDGWTMPVCEMDLRAGGAYRWVWQKGENGTQMSVTGAFREVAAPERLVHTEKFDPPWYPGEAVITTQFAEQGGKTALTLTIVYPSQETRDNVLKSDMKNGMEQSYARLERMLASADARAAH